MRYLSPTLLSLLLCLPLAAAETPPVVDIVDHSVINLPQAVKATIEAETAGKTISSIQRDIEDGQVVYIIRVEQQGIDKKITIAASGVIVKVSDYTAVNGVLADSKEAWDKTKDASEKAWDKTKDASEKAWDKTKDVASNTWEATKDTVQSAINSFSSDELTLNQVPKQPRLVIEREAAGNRITNIHVSGEGVDRIYSATVAYADGTKRTLAVREDGQLAKAP